MREPMTYHIRPIDLLGLGAGGFYEVRRLSRHRCPCPPSSRSHLVLPRLDRHPQRPIQSLQHFYEVLFSRHHLWQRLHTVLCECSLKFPAVWRCVFYTIGRTTQTMAYIFRRTLTTKFPQDSIKPPHYTRPVIGFRKRWSECGFVCFSNPVFVFTCLHSTGPTMANYS